MQEGIHPKYNTVIFYDAAADYKFLSGSTRTSSETMEWGDGNVYPVIRVDISSASHPFYTGKQKFVEVGGRVDKFKQRLAQKK
jgi:large subunit ribosomal protein L31